MIIINNNNKKKVRNTVKETCICLEAPVQPWPLGGSTQCSPIALSIRPSAAPRRMEAPGVRRVTVRLSLVGSRLPPLSTGEGLLLAEGAAARWLFERLKWRQLQKALRISGSCGRGYLSAAISVRQRALCR